jgi:hypothetical protein
VASVEDTFSSLNPFNNEANDEPLEETLEPAKTTEQIEAEELAINHDTSLDKPLMETDTPVLEPSVSFVEPPIEASIEPTVEPTVEPIVEPTVEPTVEPIVEPTVEPTVEPHVEPTVEPTVEPVSNGESTAKDAPVVGGKINKGKKSRKNRK